MMMKRGLGAGCGRWQRGGHWWPAAIASRGQCSAPKRSAGGVAVCGWGVIGLVVQAIATALRCW